MPPPSTSPPRVSKFRRASRGFPRGPRRFSRDDKVYYLGKTNETTKKKCTCTSFFRKKTRREADNDGFRGACSTSPPEGFQVFRRTSRGFPRDPRRFSRDDKVYYLPGRKNKRNYKKNCFCTSFFRKKTRREADNDGFLEVTIVLLTLLSPRLHPFYGRSLSCGRNLPSSAPICRASARTSPYPPPDYQSTSSTRCPSPCTTETQTSRPEGKLDYDHSRLTVFAVE